MDPTFRATQRAAILLAERTWQAGQSVEAALTAAGYARHIIQGITDYYRGYASSGVEETQPDSQTEMAPRVKRARQGAKTKVAPTVKKYVKKCMDRLVDDKYKVVSATTTNVSTAGGVQGDFLLITQGLTTSTRIGNAIRVKKFEHYGFMTCDVPDVLRVIWAWDKQCNGTVPGVTDILDNNTINAMYNCDTVAGHGGSRFQIVSDKRYVIQPNIAATTTFKLHSKTWKGDKVIRYDGTAGAIADLVSNNLVMLTISAAGFVDIQGNCRATFQDA